MSSEGIPLPQDDALQPSGSEKLQSSDVGLGLEAAFHKYVQVWLWSILVAAATSETVSFLGFGGLKWGLLGIGLIAISLMGSIAALGALLLLARFFGGYLLPVFFANAHPDGMERRTAAIRLKQSLNLIIFALAMRMLISVAELSLTTVAGSFHY
jgi:hypothetical protein